jgi:sugar fermentation stimulation protein A
MRLPADLRPAAILARLNRFAARVDLDGREEVVHLANSGRLHELLIPGTPALLAPRDSPGRKTRFDLLLVRIGGQWVSADARLPNALVSEALAAGTLPPFRAYPVVGTEARYGESRIDFLLEGEGGLCLLETKSVTLVEAGLALFPDAPTLRGVRHLRTLVGARAEGRHAAVVFVVQRGDARAFACNEPADPLFARTLREAAAAGVRVYAYRYRVTPQEIRLAEQIPVSL